nr:hypothetical protein K-LCC10_0296 [Kaumoebavirus]
MDSNKLLLAMMNDPEMGDITIKYKDGERKVMGFIMKAKSDYFKTLLDSQMVEGQTKTLDLGETSEGALNIVLHQFYLGKIPRDGNVYAEDLVEAYCLVHQWDIKEFLDEYLSVIWPNPQYSLDEGLKKYPITKALCIHHAKDILKKITGPDRVFWYEPLKEIGDLSCRVIAYTLMNGNLTEEALEKIYKDWQD